VYDDLLELCGYTPEEQKNELPRIEKAFEVLGIDKIDAERSAAHIMQYQDTELMGFRIMRGVGLRELVNLVLAREENKKVVYFTPTVCGGMEAFVLAGNNPGELYCQSPELVFSMVLGGVLGPWHLTPLLEGGEENGLRAGQAHCGGFQTKIGAIARGIIPRPDLLFNVGSIACIQASATDTLAHELFDVPVIYMDTADYPEHDSWPEIHPRHVEYAAETMRRCTRQFEQMMGVTITDELKKQAALGPAITVSPMVSIASMLKNDPVPIGLHELYLGYFMGILPMRSENRERAKKATNMMLQEISQRVKEGKGVMPKGTPRIFFSGAPFVDDTIMAMVNSVGLVAGASGMVCVTAPEKVKSIHVQREEKNIEALYRKAIWHNGVAVGDYFAEICRDYKVEGAIIMNSVSCRVFNACTLLQKDHLEKKLGFPVLALEGDINDSRNYSAERMRTRLETYAEIVNANRASRV
jgi:benzoyl-CoA reductase/2-hydroxyglutaryl-CoA dehydratase subunit BcrC/BadD/HgdB